MRTPMDRIELAVSRLKNEIAINNPIDDDDRILRDLALVLSELERVKGQRDRLMEAILDDEKSLTISGIEQLAIKIQNEIKGGK